MKNIIYNSNGKLSKKIEWSDIDESSKLISLRKAGECHKTVRKELIEMIKPEMKLIDMCLFVEKRTKEILGDDINGGIGFPTGLSINNIIAHDSAIPNDTRVLKNDDLIKIDIGTHVNGHIIDSAFSFSFNPIYGNLIDATKEATWMGIKMSGPDALIGDISNAIHEVIESHEIELGGKLYDINPTYGLGGHNILPYKIHGGKIILSKKTDMKNLNEQRMDVGECYAIETFASSGTGMLRQSNIPITHYMLNDEYEKKVVESFAMKNTKKVYNWIMKNRGTLPFSSRWIAEDMPYLKDDYKLGLCELMKNKIITGYPALEDAVGTYTTQMEHTIYLHDYGKEVLSHSPDDY